MKKLLLPSLFVFLLAGCGGGGPTFDDKPLSTWLKEAKTSSGAERRRAIQALSEIAVQNRSSLNQVIPALIEQLSDKDVEGRRAAATALGKQGIEAKVAVKDLIKALSDPDSEVRANAAQALVDIDPGDSQLVDPLIKALSDKDREVRRTAVIALGTLGPIAKPATPKLMEMRDQEKKDFEFRRDIGTALEKINPKNQP